MCFRPTSSFWFHLNSKSYTPPPPPCLFSVIISVINKSPLN